MPASPSSRQTGALLAFGGILLISLDSLWIRLSGVSGWLVAFWVGVFTLISTGTIMALRAGPSLPAAVARDGVPLVVSALLNTCSLTFFVLAIGATTVANTVAIIATAPLASAVFARVLLKERPSPRTWFGVVGSAVGILVIVWGSVGAGTVGGDMLALLAVIAFAANVTLWRRYPEISRLAVIGLGGLFTSVVTFVPADPLSVPSTALGILAVMGLVTGPAGRVSLASSTRYLPAAQVGLFTPVETVAASAWAWLFLSETPPRPTIVGGSLVIAVVLYGSWGAGGPRSRSR